jgi:hypothetical protein
MDSWLAARAQVAVPEFAVAPGFGLAYSGPSAPGLATRARTEEEFEE